MGGAEGVVFAFQALGKAGQPAARAQRADAIAATRENLVRIGLVPDVPDQFVVWRVEHVMQRDSELDDAKSGSEMPAGYGNRTDRLGAQLIGNLLEICSVVVVAGRKAL